MSDETLYGKVTYQATSTSVVALSALPSYCRIWILSPRPHVVLGRLVYSTAGVASTLQPYRSRANFCGQLHLPFDTFTLVPGGCCCTTHAATECESVLFLTIASSLLCHAIVSGGRLSRRGGGGARQSANVRFLDSTPVYYTCYIAAFSRA